MNLAFLFCAVDSSDNGKKILQAMAEAYGKSVNAYINKAIDQHIEREAEE